MIEDTLAKSEYLNGSILPLYHTPAGERLYQKNLELLQRKFPQYVAELEGMATGAQVPFYKVQTQLQIKCRTTKKPGNFVSKTHRKLFFSHLAVALESRSFCNFSDRRV